MQDFIAFLLPARETDIDGAFQHFILDAKLTRLAANHLHELKMVDFIFTLFTAARVDSPAKEAHAADTGQFNRVLKRQEHPGPGAFISLHFKDRNTVQQNIAAGDFIAVTPCQHIGKRAFARPVRPHDGVDFTTVDGKGNTLENFRIANRGMEIANFNE